MTRKVNAATEDMIKGFEGLPGGKPALTLYKDPAGIPTIAWGHAFFDEHGKPLAENLCPSTITLEEAEAYLDKDLSESEGFIDSLYPWLNDNQFGALVSFVFNVGEGNFKISTLKRLLDFKDLDPQKISSAFGLFNKARVNGQLTVLGGLTRRRSAESSLFLTPVPEQHTEKSLEVKVTEANVTPVKPPVLTAQRTVGGVVGGTIGVSVVVDAVNQATPLIQQVQNYNSMTSNLSLCLKAVSAVILLSVAGYYVWKRWRGQ